MQKNKLNLHIYGIHLLNPHKTVVSHLNQYWLIDHVRYILLKNMRLDWTWGRIIQPYVVRKKLIKTTHARRLRVTGLEYPLEIVVVRSQ